MPAISKRASAAAKKAAATRRAANLEAQTARTLPPRAGRGQRRRALTNDDEERQGVTDAAGELLLQAQEEEARLIEEEAEAIRVAAEEEAQAAEDDTELAATLARVEELKARKETRLGTRRPISTTLAFRGGMPSTQEPLSSFWSGEMTPLVAPELSRRYPAIDETHFKAIKENKFRPINVVKLSTDVVLDRSKVKILTVGSDVALEAREEDAIANELKSVSHLIRCFILYMNILLHFTHNALEKPLRIGMLAYAEQLWSFSSSYTFESIRNYHFLFHQLRTKRGLDDGALWAEGDRDLERKLRLKPTQPDSNPAFKRSNTGASTGQFRAPTSTANTGHDPNQQICNRFNNGLDCWGHCKYRHVCIVCYGLHRGKDCRSSNPKVTDNQPFQGTTPTGPNNRPVEPRR